MAEESEEYDDYATNVIWYDVDCWKGPFSDDILALEYENSIAESNCDSDCLGDGTKWSVLYSMNGFTLLLLALDMIFVVFGAFYFWPRVLGACFNCLLSCAHFGAIITTAVFRFRTQGKLCSLSLRPSRVDSDLNFKDGHTFETDGQMILALWICQLVFFVIFCCGGCISAKHATQAQMDTLPKTSGENRQLIPNEMNHDQ